jgi:hypothetical protein
MVQFVGFTLVTRADHVHPVDTSRQESLSGSGIVKPVAGTISYLTDNSTTGIMLLLKEHNGMAEL